MADYGRTATARERRAATRALWRALRRRMSQHNRRLKWPWVFGGLRFHPPKVLFKHRRTQVLRVFTGVLYGKVTVSCTIIVGSAGLVLENIAGTTGGGCTVVLTMTRRGERDELYPLALHQFEARGLDYMESCNLWLDPGTWTFQFQITPWQDQGGRPDMALALQVSLPPDDMLKFETSPPGSECGHPHSEVV